MDVEKGISFCHARAFHINSAADPTWAKRLGFRYRVTVRARLPHCHNLNRNRKHRDMSTNNTAANGNLEAILPIRAVSGGERGNKEAGKKHDYLLPKAAFMALVSEVFDKEVERSNAENAKSGGAVSQFLHSYGATADKQEKSGIDPFPALRFALVHPDDRAGDKPRFVGTEAECDKWELEQGRQGAFMRRESPAEFNGDNMESWLEVMEFKAARTGGGRKSAKDIQMDAALATLAIPGITWEMLAPAYKGITEADLETYKAKLAEKMEA